jgi:hypothetical protein
MPISVPGTGSAGSASAGTPSLGSFLVNSGPNGSARGGVAGSPNAGSGSGYSSNGCRGGFCPGDLAKKANAQLNPNARPDQFETGMGKAAKTDCLRPAKNADGRETTTGLLALPQLMNRALNGDCP